eukprot:4996856-Pleurochrysis_carterae.AAC.1
MGTRVRPIYTTHAFIWRVICKCLLLRDLIGRPSGAGREWLLAYERGQPRSGSGRRRGGKAHQRGGSGSGGLEGSGGHARARVPALGARSASAPQ